MIEMMYGPDIDFGYMCTETLILEIRPWAKIHDTSLVMENICVKYY